MSTIIYPSPVFGPVHSRRLGISLGINLLPEGAKLCNFDCVYCECGLNAWHRAHSPMPTPDEVLGKLRDKLGEMKREGLVPDVLTFAGNGEPTLHPQFPEILRSVVALRDAACPEARVSLLSNATQLHRPEIREAMQLLDHNILKLDTVDADYIRLVDRPQGSYSVERQIGYMRQLRGHLAVQTLFMTGTMEGKSVDNTSPRFVGPYIEALRLILPSRVMIYTIDRETPFSGLLKASPQTLDRIATEIRTATGLEVSVGY